MAKHIIINAIHTKTGGGLVFFNHIMPLLAKSKALTFTVIAHEKYAPALNIPKNVKLHTVDFEDKFFKTLVWEQVNIPKLVKRLKGEATFNIANYCALFAKSNVLYITNNPEVRHYVSGMGAKLYWHALIWMTRLSLMIASKALVNGNYMKNVYAGGIFSYLQNKMIKATTACDATPSANVKKNKDKIIAIGDFYAHKDYPCLIKAFAHVVQEKPNAKLTIIGREIDENLATDIKYLASLLKVEDKITFTGALPHAEAQERLACAHVYASPSDAEAFSLTLLEAMKLGTASVVKNHAFQKEVSISKAAEHVEIFTNKEAQARAFSDGILKVLSDKNREQALIQAGQKIASEYSWKNTASIIEGVLKEA